MFIDNKGQLSLEYLLIFVILLIILIIFTFPLLNLAIETIDDISEVSKIKYELNKLAIAIDEVYSEGHFSKRTIYLSLNNDISVNIREGIIYVDYDLNNGALKNINQSILNSNLNTNINLNKGDNKLVITWLNENSSVLIEKL